MPPTRRYLRLLTAYAVSSCIGPGALGFAPTSRRLTTRTRAASPVSYSAPLSSATPSLPSPSRTSSTAISSSRDQAEQCLAESYPKFFWLLNQNPAALERMRESTTGFAVLAPSDAALEALGPERIQLLETACNDPDVQQVVSRMAAYHMVSAPMTAEIMATYNVVNTRVGELPVEVAPDGSLYVNGVRIIQSYQFEDKVIQNYQDKNGNLLGSEAVEGGKRCIIHEVEGLVCPDELWHAMYSHYQSSGAMGAM